MEQLAAQYASSSSDDEGSQSCCPGGCTESAHDRANASPNSTSSGAAGGTANAHKPRPREDDTSLREAIARRFAARAATATHRTTTEERQYAYKPYETKRPRVEISELKKRRRDTKTKKMVETDPPLDPLFPTFSALPQTHTRSKMCDYSDANKRTTPLPRLQDNVQFSGHTGAVNCLDWNPRYPPLFLSASMDHSVRVWSLPRIYYEHEESISCVPKRNRVQGSLCRRVLSHHTQGVKNAKWALDGQHIWSGGYDRLAGYVDVESGFAVQLYQHASNEHVTCVCVHPEDPQLALFGTDRGRILLRDLRMDTTTTAATYGTKTTGEVHDIMFLPRDDGQGDETGKQLRFVSSSALTARDTSYQTLVVWDFRSSALVTDHLNNDLCSFTSLRLHPNNKSFVAQSTESEAVWFSARAPYKRLKPKRSFVSGHEVEGFNIRCSFNATGSVFATGDINGRVVLYCARTQRLFKQLHEYSSTTPSLCTEFHPQWASTLISGGYDGRICLFDALNTRSMC